MPDPANFPFSNSVWRTGPLRQLLSPDRIGFVLGPLVLIGWLLFTDPGALRPEAHRLAGILLLTFIWWVTEPIPLAATGLLSMILCVLLGALPAQSGRDGIRSVLAPFADPSVFFLMGGLFIGRAMTSHGLDRRLALSLLCTRWAGRSPATLLATVGLSVTLISMWISNTAAAAMMCPVTIGIISVLAANSPSAPSGSGHLSGFAHSRFATALLLITAFGASVGGIATPIGTATNVVALGFLGRPDILGRSVDFLGWCVVGVPMMTLIFAGMFFWLRFLSPPDRLNMPALREFLHAEHARLGHWKRGETNTLWVFLIVVSLWIAPGVLALVGAAETQKAFVRILPEEVIALLAPVLLFLLPVDFGHRRFTLESADFQKIDWGTLLMYGAALSLGVLMFRTGLAEAMGRGIFEWLGTRDLWMLTAVAIVSGILLSEFTSNAATASALLPVVHQLCVEAGVNPLPPLLGVTFAASFGSSLPVSTPPNAIVYSTGLTPVRRMIPAGFGLDVVAGVVIWLVLRIAWEFFNWSPMTNA